MSRFRRQDGALSAEFLALVPLLVLMAVVGWQLLIIVAAGTSTANAARNGARAASVGQPPAPAVEGALPAWLRPGHQVTASGPDGTRIEVEVVIPNVFDAVPWSPLRITRTAELPYTD